jgi:hypothetical protein
MEANPFRTIESAEEFLGLLHTEIIASRGKITALLHETDPQSDRRIEALRLVIHKLDQLARNTEGSHRLLGDLRMLRNLLSRQ